MKKPESIDLELRAPGNFLLKLNAQGPIATGVFGVILALACIGLLWINYPQRPMLLPAEVMQLQHK